MNSPARPRGAAAGSSAKVPEAAPGIELVLLAGQSPTARVVFSAQVPPTRALVGSDPSVDWPLSAPEVEPHHAEIAWDGATLWLRDNGSARGTYVGHERVNDWRAVTIGEEIWIGQARLAARPNVPTGAMPAASVPVPSPVRAPSTAPSPDDFDDDAATQVGRAMPHGVVSSARASVRPPQPAAPAAAPLPRAPSTLSAAPSTASSRDPERTVITVSPYDPPDGAQPAAPYPPPAAPRVAGGSVPLPRVTTRPSSPVVPAFTDSEATAAVDLSAVPPVSPAYPAPSTATPGANTVPPGGVPAYNAPAPAPAAGPGGGVDARIHDAFGAPPPPNAGELTRLFGAIPPSEAQSAPAPRTGLASLPRRTLVLFGVTLIAGAIMLVGVFRDDGATGPAPPPRNPAPEAQRPAQAFTPPIPAAPVGPTGSVLSASIPPVPPVAPEPQPANNARAPRRPAAAVAPVAPTMTPERAAADAVAQGRFREAIALYENLARVHPETQVYAHTAVILRRQLEAQEHPCPPGSLSCGNDPVAAPQR